MHKRLYSNYEEAFDDFRTRRIVSGGTFGSRVESTISSCKILDCKGSL